MEAFLYGMAIGIAGAVLVFVILNLEIPDKLDDFEEDVRDGTDSYQNAKTSLLTKIKRRFQK